MACLHNFNILHHYGEGDKHYCPTGFYQCSLCGEIIETPQGEEVCDKWDEA